MPVKNKKKWVVTVLAYIYLTGLFILFFFSRDRLSKVDYRRFYNLRPLVKIFHFNWANPNAIWLYYLEIVSNIMVFIPFAVALCVIIKRINKVAVYAIIVIVPLLIEVMQYIFAVGVFDVDDIILNITGGLIGALLYYKYILPWYLFTASD